MALMWRTDEPEIKEGVVVKGGMWHSQKIVMMSAAYIVAFLGGYGSGKSTILAKFSIAMCLHNSPSPFMAVSPSYKQAKRTIIPAIKALLDGRNIEYKWNKTDHEFIIRCKGAVGTLWIGSGQDADSLKGSNLCGFALDEFTIMKEEVFNQLIARVRDPIAKLRRILLAGTPEGVIGWAYDMCHEFGKNRHKYDLQVVEAPTTENKALPKEFIKTLIAAYDEKMRDAYMSGKFVNMSVGLIYHNFDQNRHVKTVRALPGEEVYLGLDFNVSPLSGILLVKRDKKLCYFKEIIMDNISDTLQIMDRAWALSNDELTTVFPDPSGIQKKTSAVAGTTDFTLIYESGIRNRGEKFRIVSRRRTPALKDRWNAVNAHFREDLVEIDPSCTAFINGLKFLTHENRTKAGEPFTHMTDAGTYVMENLFSIALPVTKARRFYN